MKHFIPLLITLQVAAGTALAQCPTKADLSTGIRFTLASGETETFRASGDAVVESLFVAPDPQANRVLLAHGVYLLEYVDVENGVLQPDTRATYSYPMKAPDMPLPQPGGSWTVTAAVFDRGELRSENQVYAFGASSQITFQTCSYQMFPIEIAYPNDPDLSGDVLHYLPELGLSYLAESTYGDTTDRYDYVRIETVK